MIQSFQLPDALWEALLRPLDGSHPCGRSLLYEPVYDEIREARTHEDENLPQGIWKRDLKKADWRQVETLCCEALTQETKDLQIAAWLAESWLQQYGLKGFAKGLEVIRRLTATFWEDIHPPLQEGDPEYRLAPFAWLDDKLLERLNLLPITAPSNQGGKVYCFEDWQRAQHHGQNQKTPQAGAEASPDVSVTDFKQSQNLTPTLFYQERRTDLKGCLDEIQILETLITSHEPNYPGFLSHLRAKLQAILVFVDIVLTDRCEEPETGTSSHGDRKKTPQDRSSSSKMQTYNGQISSREQAYQCLAEAADFLARLEPHSPTPYLVRRAITWGSMSLVDLLEEIVADPGDLHQIMQLLGQQGKSASEQEL